MIIILPEALAPHELNVRVYGACPDCDAYRIVREVAPRVYEGFVFHDDSCPWLAEYERR